MEMSLKDARVLVGKLGKTDITEQYVEIRSYDVGIAGEDLKEAEDNLLCEIWDNIDTIDLKYDLKFRINEVNMKCGVTSLLNQRDKLNEQLAMLGKLDKCDSHDRQLEVIEDLGKTHATINALNEGVEEVRAKCEADISQRLAEIFSEVGRLNRNNSITLSDREVELLTEGGYL